MNLALNQVGLYSSLSHTAVLHRVFHTLPDMSLSAHVVGVQYEDAGTCERGSEQQGLCQIISLPPIHVRVFPLQCQESFPAELLVQYQWLDDSYQEWHHTATYRCLFTTLPERTGAKVSTNLRRLNFSLYTFPEAITHDYIAMLVHGGFG